MSQAPRAPWRFLPSTGFGTCLQVARVEQQDLPDTGVRLGEGLVLNAGLRVRPPGHWGLDVRGEYALQGYAMRPSGDRFVQYNNVPRVELQPTYYPAWLDEQQVQVAIGLAAGICYAGVIGPSNIDEEYTVTSTVAPDPRPYLALDIAAGVLDQGGPNIEVALRYLAHLDRGAAWTSTVVSEDGEATFSASDNYFSMVLRLYFGGKKEATKSEEWVIPSR